MDPLTQGLIGASAPQLLTSKCRSIAWAGCFGLIAGMAPDLDVLIRSSSDPLLFLEYHRQFTHSIIFIPIGGLLISGILHFLFRKISFIIQQHKKFPRVTPNNEDFRSI